RQAPPAYEDIRAIGTDGLRQAIRRSAYCGHTAGLAAGRLQAHVVVLPQPYAHDFLHFCRRNPKPLPLVGIGRIGSPMLPALGDVDVRTDAPRYDIYRFGILIARRTDIADLWRDNLAAFAIGSDFTFDHALIRQGVALRHIAGNRTVPMFR